MSAAGWIFLIGLFLLVIVGAGLYLLCQFLLQKMPKQQREAAEWAAKMTLQFVREAVQTIEQTKGDLNGATKKEMALKLALKYLNKFGVPVSSIDILEDLIESAVSLLPDSKTHG